MSRGMAHIKAVSQGQTTVRFCCAEETCSRGACDISTVANSKYQRKEGKEEPPVKKIRDSDNVRWPYSCFFSQYAPSSRLLPCPELTQIPFSTSTPPCKAFIPILLPSSSPKPVPFWAYSVALTDAKKTMNIKRPL